MSEYGATANPTLTGSIPEQSVAWSVAPPHPWRRMFATLYDISVFGQVVMAFIAIMIGVALPSGQAGFDALPFSLGGNYLWFFLLGLGAIVPMALFLAEFGTTPGKWIWGIRVERKDGGPCSFGLMLKRELWMLFVGLGANLGIIALGCGVVARGTLMKTGETGWDRRYGTQTLHREVPPARIALGMTAAIVLMIALSAS